MAIRSGFDKELNILKENLLEMVKLSKQAVEDAMDALANQNADKAEKIIKADIKINEYDEKINHQVIQLIAHQQPVASDLRRIIAGLKISGDVERIGDLAVNIAKCILHIGNGPLIKPIIEIPKMADMALGMLSDVLQAFIEGDVALAKKAADADDKVDELFGKLTNELLELMTKHPESISQITQLILICRNIERLGDHSTNIAEHIIFMVKGKKIDLNA